MKYKTAKEFVLDMMDNEDIIFCDSYGREWVYHNHNFFYKDINEDYLPDKLSCLHLFGTEIIKKELTKEQKETYPRLVRLGDPDKIAFETVLNRLADFLLNALKERENNAKH